MNNKLPKNMSSTAQPQLDFEQATDVACDECGKQQFQVKYLLKRFSALVSPTGEEMIVPMSVFVCSNCNHINEEFLP